MGLAWVFGLNKDIIKINNDKYIEFLSQSLTNITLEASWCIGEPKKHYLVFEVAVSSLESCFPFIAFFNPHPMIKACEIKLGELFGST